MISRKDVEEIVLNIVQTVVMPAFETVATKSDLKRVEGRLDTVDNRLESVDRKVDRIAAKQLEDSGKLETHGKRIKRLEQKAFI